LPGKKKGKGKFIRLRLLPFTGIQGDAAELGLEKGKKKRGEGRALREFPFGIFDALRSRRRPQVQPGGKEKGEKEKKCRSMFPHRPTPGDGKVDGEKKENGRKLAVV